MKSLSRIITGSVIILFGIWFFFFIGIVDGPKIDVFGIITGALLIALGFFIFLNKKEDVIEQIKKQRKK